jgi:hypothetical protein
LTLVAHKETRLFGCAIAVALAAAAMLYGQRTRNATFVIYAWVYGTIAIDIAVCGAMDFTDFVFTLLYLLVSTVAAIVGLFISHARIRKAAA